MAKALSFIFWSETRESRQRPGSTAHRGARLVCSQERTTGRSERTHAPCVCVSVCVCTSHPHTLLPTQHISGAEEVDMYNRTL